MDDKKLKEKPILSVLMYWAGTNHLQASVWCGIDSTSLWNHTGGMTSALSKEIPWLN